MYAIITMHGTTIILCSIYVIILALSLILQIYHLSFSFRSPTTTFLSLVMQNFFFLPVSILHPTDFPFASPSIRLVLEILVTSWMLRTRDINNSNILSLTSPTDFFFSIIIYTYIYVYGKLMKTSSYTYICMYIQT